MLACNTACFRTKLYVITSALVSKEIGLLDKVTIRCYYGCHAGCDRDFFSIYNGESVLIYTFTMGRFDFSHWKNGFTCNRLRAKCR